MIVTTWQQWAACTLTGIEAPLSPTNIATLRGWSMHEKGGWPSIQWCNPLNTTEPWPGAVNSGAQPGAHDVKVYRTLQDGCSATVATLLAEPYYPAIVAALRDSQPASWWGPTARAELDTWGTGQGWLDAVPFAVDVSAQLDDIQARAAEALGHLRGTFKATYPQQLSARFDKLDAEIAAIPAAKGGAADLTPVLNALAALAAKVDAQGADIASVRMRIEKDLAP